MKPSAPSRRLFAPLAAVALGVAAYLTGDGAYAGEASGGAAHAVDAADIGSRLGLALRPLKPAERRELGSNGLVVEKAGGLAARAGIQAGDVVLSVNGTPIDSIAQLRALAALSQKTMAILVERANGKIFVPIDLSGG